ncbi:hypothetical protein PZ938_05510 [Luteipulveratus sp. YIM 133132]|uniref:hypothetical protein n=1 Tax=Luteipulveratus flavus TaxID=3031728 RepID=UPI0023B1A1B4|nr:hypothetical protein [Luteipulveratus sp. YIM 133132]MDE9365058.1 hypothetical protein [Luteipulveratus sp. YIM 133132]
MTGWDDVSDVCGRLPGAELGEAHEGSPAWYAGRHPFARLRWDECDRELLQVWTAQMDTAQVLGGRRGTFPVIHTFSHRVSLWAVLDDLDRREVTELLLDSYGARGGRRRLAAVDVEALLP